MENVVGGPGHLLGAIFSAAPDTVIVVDHSGTIVLSSPSVTDLFGYFPEELVGEPVNVLIPHELRSVHDTHIAEFVATSQARKMGAGVALRGLHRDGSTFPIDVSLSGTEVSGTTYVAAFVRDAREQSRSIERLNALNDITQRLLSGASIESVLPIVARHARRLANARASWVVVPGLSAELTIAAADGEGTEILLGTSLSAVSSRSAKVMETGTVDIIEDFHSAENVPSAVAALDLGPGIYIPLIADRRHLGALVIAREAGAAPFASLDIALAEVFASSTAVAFELGYARQELGRLELVEEDERIARDLHDTVIQQLFAVGMSLQVVRQSLPEGAEVRIESAISDLDAVIKEIRNTIFRLPSRVPGDRDLRNEVIRISEKYRDQLAFSPQVTVATPADASLSDVVIDQLLRVLNEALSNVVRHARATSVNVNVRLDERDVLLTVDDDGVGLPDPPAGGQGFANMAGRARDLGGAFSVAAAHPTGTHLEWRVPS